MTRPSIWLDKFDRDHEFEVIRPFKVSGIEFDRGDTFDKTLVTTRTLRQLYESRKLQVATNPPEVEARITVQHVGRGRFAVFQDGQRITETPMTKDEAELYASN